MDETEKVVDENQTQADEDINSLDMLLNADVWINKDERLNLRKVFRADSDNQREI